MSVPIDPDEAYSWHWLASRQHHTPSIEGMTLAEAKLTVEQKSNGFRNIRCSRHRSCFGNNHGEYLHVNPHQIHIDELWAFGCSYFRSFVSCAIITCGIAVPLLLARRRWAERWSHKTIYGLLLVPAFVWLTYLIVTARETFAITSLDTEDDELAEVVYKSIFDVDLNKAVKFAIDKGQTGNVRFYASCRIADLLVTNDDSRKAVELARVTGAPDFRTGFFKTNQLTCGFFTPNHAEGPFTVSEIIRKRLQIIRNQGGEWKGSIGMKP